MQTLKQLSFANDIEYKDFKRTITLECVSAVLLAIADEPVRQNVSMLIHILQFRVEFNDYAISVNREAPDFSLMRYNRTKHVRTRLHLEMSCFRCKKLVTPTDSYIVRRKCKLYHKTCYDGMRI